MVDWRVFSSQRLLPFCSIGTRVGLMCRLSSEQPLNCFLVQNFTAARPSCRPSAVTTRLECARMPHCQHAPLVEPVSRRASAGLTHEFGMLPLIQEDRGVLQNQYRVGCGRETCSTSIKMPAQDIVFANPVFGEEAIGALGRSPVLTGEKDRLSHPAP